MFLEVTSFGRQSVLLLAAKGVRQCRPLSKMNTMSDGASLQQKTSLHAEGSAHTCCKDKVWMACGGVTCMMHRLRRHRKMNRTPCSMSRRHLKTKQGFGDTPWLQWDVPREPLHSCSSQCHFSKGSAMGT